MKKGIIFSLMIIFIFGFVGCVSYTHYQEIKNDTGVTVDTVQTRDTGAPNWSEVRNVQTQYRQDGSSYVQRVPMNNGTQLVFFRETGSSLNPKGMRNQDILVKDTNGLLYMKQNVEISFSTTKKTDLLLFNGPTEVLVKSEPISITAADRLPMLYVVNQTGFPLTVISPVQNSIPDKQRIQFQPTVVNRSIDVTYRISQATYTESVTMANQDATVTLTKRPPTLTIMNNVGYTVNLVFLRNPGANWTGQNVLNLQLRPDGTVDPAQATATAGERRGSITNRESFRLWLGNVDISPDRYDIRIDDVQGNSYVKRNVQITSDMTLTFTQSDKS